MPVFNVTSPDGAVYKITAPEGATEADAIAYAQQQHGEIAPVKPTQEQIDTASKSSRFVQGIKDPVNGLAQLMLHSLPDKGILKGSAQYLDNELAGKERAYEDARKATGNDGIDWMKIGGNLIGTAPVMAVAPGGGTALVGRAIAGAGTGAALNGLNPVTEEGDFWANKGDQAQTGAIAGGIAAPVSEMAARVINPKVSNDVKKLLDSNVNLTPGQILGGFYKTVEDKATSVPLLGDVITASRRNAVKDLNKAVLDRSVSPIGKTADKVGNEGIESAKSALSAAYNDVLPNLTLQPTQKFASEIGHIRSTIRPALIEDFDSIFKSEVLHRLENGALTGQALKDAESSLSRQAKNYASSGDAAQRELGVKLKESLGAFRNALSDQNPALAPQLQKINQGYSNFKIAEKAASKDINGGVFSPAQLQQAVRQGGGTGKFASGNAQMQDLSQAAQNVMGGGYPDSGTTGRALLAAFMGGAGAPLAVAHPVGATIAAAAMLPYTTLGKKGITALLTKRPEQAASVANFLRMLPSPVGNGLGYSFLAGGK